ncbi:MAG: ABC transporter permease subunit [Alphaproteobacteria bacterium]|nr:ABC transporter permease subunit [Alphaproteobacteria bacterium]
MSRILRLIPLVLILGFAPFNSAADQNPWAAPELLHPLGTDEFGRDALLTLLIASARSIALGTSLAIGVTAAATLFAYWLVFRSGRFGGAALLSLIQVVESIPVVIWVLAAFSATGAGSKSVAGLVFFIAMLPFATAIAAGEFWRLRKRPFVEAALLAGIGGCRLLQRHLVPNATSVLLPLLVQIVGLAIMIEGATGLLGFTNRTDLDLGVVLLRGKENVGAHPALLVSVLAAFAVIFLALRSAQRALSRRDRLDPTPA